MTERCEHCNARLGGVRYPLQPLADLFPDESIRGLCERLKVSGSTFDAYMCHGMLAKTADMVAARAGVPAYSVWPEMLDDHIAMSQRQCAECDALFVPSQGGQKYCSRRCCGRRTAREWERRRRESDPEFRERERQRKAAYYGEVREYAVRWQREYRQRQRESAA